MMQHSVDRNDGRYRVGLRNIKTAIAVGISLLVFQLLGISDGIQASITAIICMKSSLQNSIQTGVERILGTIFGAVLGMVMLLILLKSNPWLAFPLAIVGVVLIIYLCNIFKIQNSIVISLVVFLMILIGEKSQPPLVYGTMRLLETIFGIVTAYFVNRFIDPRHLHKGESIDSTSEIREFKPDDIGKVMALWLSSHLRIYPEENPLVFHESYDAAREGYLSGDAAIFVYEKDCEKCGEIIGFIAVNKEIHVDGPYLRSYADRPSVGRSLVVHLQGIYRSLESKVPASPMAYENIFLEEGFVITSESHHPSLDMNLLTLKWQGPPR